MSRLFFAAARGARIQINGFTATVPSWYDSHKWSSMHESVLRIHPDDEHLQYGPISATFMTWAGLQVSDHEDFVSVACVIADDYEADWAMQYDNELHRSLFLLILAEALADKGL